jgi:hypothetical protein
MTIAINFSRVIITYANPVRIAPLPFGLPLEAVQGNIYALGSRVRMWYRQAKKGECIVTSKRLGLG